MSKLTKTNEETRFGEYMGGFFHDFLRAAGITMTPGNTMERVRSIGERMALAIEDAAEKKAVAVAEAIQSRVEAGFVSMEAVLTKVKDLQTKTSVAVLNLVENHTKTAGEIERLKIQVEQLKRDIDLIRQGRGPGLK